MPPVDRKRKIHKTNAKAVDSISFDFDSRNDYLTGFHKRKVARRKHAEEENAKKDKEEKLRFRREVRSPKIPTLPALCEVRPAAKEGSEHCTAPRSATKTKPTT